MVAILLRFQTINWHDPVDVSIMFQVTARETELWHLLDNKQGLPNRQQR